MKTFIAGLLGARLLLPVIGSSALADAARNAPIGAQPGNLSPGVLARFQLEALSFRALNETGWDWLGSDEVYVAIHVPARKIATVTQLFENVEAGETTNIPANQSCILAIAGVSRPTTLWADNGDRWSCSDNGAPGPISFTVWLWEHDGCWGCFAHGQEVEGGEPQPESGDSLIGRHTVEFSREELIALQVGQVVEESATLSPCIPTPEAPLKGCGGHEAEYKFNWRLIRLPDAEPSVGPLTRLREPNLLE
jgi:hypothetical protein